MVVGAGLAGLTTADALHAAGLSVTVVEARPSVGGRIKTLVDAESWFDLGATWHWANQPRIRSLAAELGIEVFPQFRDGRAVAEDRPDVPPRLVDVPSPTPAELRFAGGAQALCLRLASRLPEGALVLETDVDGISAEASGVTVSVADAAGRKSQLSSGFAVVAVPPRLASTGITFSPALPAALAKVMQGTPTWMATAVKCVAEYNRPFWRDAGLSGLAFSRVGPLVEVHDGSTDTGSTVALWGFLSAGHDVRDLDVERRREAVFAQLGRLFGPEAADPVRYLERDWSNDPYTNDMVVWFDAPVAYGHPAFAEPRFGGRLIWAGTETADVGGGHMEGAVRSGQRAAAQVLALQK
ncbi:MAG TPA: FAD-dependent oxidoreductase [Acidimicrobiales bacterium]|nr:FAD-dependent oxidoreductase [Acidimicrobiales bacterium]